MQEFTDVGIAFVSIHDQVDLTTASGRLMVHIIASFAEFEKDLIRERTLAGLAYAKSQGKILGRPSEYDGEKIRELYHKGNSLLSIQRLLGCSLGVVYREIEADPKSPKKTQSNIQVQTKV